LDDMWACPNCHSINVRGSALCYGCRVPRPELASGGGCAPSVRDASIGSSQASMVRTDAVGPSQAEPSKANDGSIAPVEPVGTQRGPVAPASPCAHCGKTVNANDRFCAGCGHPVGLPEPSAASAPAAAARKLRVAPIAIGGLLVVIVDVAIALGGGLLRSANTPSSTVPSMLAPAPSFDMSAFRAHINASSAELAAQGQAMTTGNLTLTYTKVRNWAIDELAWIDRDLPANLECLRSFRKDYRDAVSASKLLADQVLDALAKNDVAGLVNLETQAGAIGTAIGSEQRLALQLSCP
jgi:hypothetical protein